MSLQAEDAKTGLWDVPENESREEKSRREKKFKQEMQRRERILLEEVNRHSAEECQYSWKPDDSSNPGSKRTSSATNDEAENVKDIAGDVVMGGIDYANVSSSRCHSLTNIITPFDIQQKLDLDIQKLLERGIKELKKYDDQAGKVRAEYKKVLDKDLIIEVAGAEGILKRKSASIAGPLEPSGGILKKSASTQSPLDNSSILKRSVTIQVPTDSERRALVQSPLDNGGSNSGKCVSFQASWGGGDNTSKHPAAIQIPPDSQRVFSNTSAFVQSPAELAGSVLKKVRINDPFWSPTSPSPLSINHPALPMNVPKGPASSSPIKARFSNLSSGTNGPANSDHARRPSYPSSTSQSPSTPSVPALPASSRSSMQQTTHALSLPQDFSPSTRPHASVNRPEQHSHLNDASPPTYPRDNAPHIGKTFISSISVTSNHRSYISLEIRLGDEVEITNHLKGNSYKGFNITSHETGCFDVSGFLEDIEPTGYIGRIFVSSSRFIPRYAAGFFNLEIDSGDKVKVVAHLDSNAYVGYNMTQRKKGVFNINFYLEDMKKTPPFSGPANDHGEATSLVGKTFISSHTWRPRSSNRDDLAIFCGDKIRIVSHNSGDWYEGHNITEREVGRFNISYFKHDISLEETGNISTATRSRNTLYSNAISPGDNANAVKNVSTDIDFGHKKSTGQNAGQLPLDNSKNELGRLDSLEGKIFTAARAQCLKSKKDTATLEISVGDRIEILKRISGNTYLGTNLTTRCISGQFDVGIFQKDTEAASSSWRDGNSHKMDIAPITDTSMPSNCSIDKPAEQVSFSLKASTPKLSNGKPGFKRLANGMPIITGGGSKDRASDTSGRMARRGF